MDTEAQLSIEMLKGLVGIAVAGITGIGILGGSLIDLATAKIEKNKDYKGGINSIKKLRGYELERFSVSMNKNEFKKFKKFMRKRDLPFACVKEDSTYDITFLHSQSNVVKPYLEQLVNNTLKDNAINNKEINLSKEKLDLKEKLEKLYDSDDTFIVKFLKLCILMPGLVKTDFFKAVLNAINKDKDIITNASYFEQLSNATGLKVLNIDRNDLTGMQELVTKLNNANIPFLKTETEYDYEIIYRESDEEKVNDILNGKEVEKNTEPKVKEESNIKEEVKYRNKTDDKKNEKSENEPVKGNKEVNEVKQKNKKSENIYKSNYNEKTAQKDVKTTSVEKEIARATKMREKRNNEKLPIHVKKGKDKSPNSKER